MSLTADELLDRIASAKPANEDEVETKILLHLFALLGYSDEDRADQLQVKFRKGREEQRKRADFVLYQGAERAFANALLVVEAKKVGDALDDAEDQVRSYAGAIGTPLYLACNGTELVASRFAAGTDKACALRFALSQLPAKIDSLRELIGRSAAIVLKERLGYLAEFVPKVEELPPHLFFRVYLERLRDRFQSFAYAGEVLNPPEHDPIPPRLPVHISASATGRRLDHSGVARLLRGGAKRLFIEGAPGSGKTTLCRRVTGILASDALSSASRTIPIFISLSRGVPESVLDALSRACTDLGVSTYPSLYEMALRASEVVLVFDGLDELPRETNTQARLAGLLQHASWTSALVTSRPQGLKTKRFGISAADFEYARVIPLSEDEIHEVLNTYLNDKRSVDAIWQKYRRRILPELSSPMLLLMCIRLAREIANWDSLSLFTLYEKYVGLLHAFFNAHTVRGGRAQVAVADVLNCLAHAAVLLRVSRWGRAAMSLERLQSALLSRWRGEIVGGLFNTGLIVSVGGAARFVHLTFEEFGLAWSMVKSAEREDPVGFVIGGISDTTYRIAQSGVNERVEAVLLKWLTHPSRQVRKRVVGMLKNGVSDLGAERLWDEFDKQRNTSRRHVLRTLILRGDQRAFDWLKANGREVDHQLMEAVALSARPDLIPFLFEAIPQKGPSAFRFSVDAVVTCSAIEFLPQVLAIYRASSANSRTSVVRALIRHAGSETAHRVLNLFIEAELEPEILIGHLGLAMAIQADLSMNSILSSSAVLSHEERYCARAAKRARNIADWMTRRFGERGALEPLINELKRIGARA